MSVIWNYTTGSVNKSVDSLKRALGQYSHRYGYLKVGRTNSPERRWREHQAERQQVADSWSHMVVIHESDSLAQARACEGRLIKYARARGYSAEVWNVRGGDVGGPGEQFVYVLMDAGGVAQTEVNWLYSTGHYSQVADGLTRALGQYAGKSDYLKVGRTNDPDRRWKEHQRERAKVNDHWDKMIVIYATASESSARLAEKELIDHLYRKYPTKNFNAVRGTDQPAPSIYYTYVLLD